MDKRNDTNPRRAIAPVCSISEDEGLVTVKLEMPGVTKDGIEVRIEGNELEITGSRPEDSYGGKVLLRERRVGSYRKVFTIDDSIARENIDAKLADGILALKFRVKEAAKPRRIEIA